jgi:hypothetical protein
MTQDCAPDRKELVDYTVEVDISIVCVGDPV